MLDDRTDALFPVPGSPAGKLLAHLVGRQIPGTPIETTSSAVAKAAALRTAEAGTAMSKLADDGLILVEPGAGDLLTITVLVAPPLEEFGIKPQWGEHDTPVTVIPPAVAVSGNTASADGHTTSSTGRSTSANPGGTRRGTPAAGAAGSAPAQPLLLPDAKPPSPRASQAPPAAASVAGGGAVSATEARQASRPRRQEPRETTQRGDTPEDGKRGSARRGTPEASAIVDETALVRGFVERFERLLAEIDEWKRRAQSAEERNATTEKLLRQAERRAETAEARLAEARERLQTWAELTRRMQQLSRQADGGARGRAGAARSTGNASSGTAGSGSTTASSSASGANGGKQK